ncbi:hypothetical protein U1Q18_020528, partial [Sarracenia purpurea var. burkii]
SPDELLNDRLDLDVAIALRRYEFDRLLPISGHHGISGNKGGILDVTTPMVGGLTTPMVGGYATLSFDQYTIEEANHER